MIAKEKAPSSKEQLSYVLRTQKQTMKKAFLDYLWSAIFLFALTVILFVFGFTSDDVTVSIGRFLAGAAMILVIILAFAVEFMRRYLLFAKFNKIRYSKICCVTIVCKKVSFLMQPTSRHSSKIICIIFTDENGKKYYNVTKEIPDKARKDIRKKLLDSSITLDCYENTDCVKSYEIL